MDFIIYLPTSRGYNVIMVIINCFMKIRYFIPCKGTCDSEEAARLFTKYAWKLYSLPMIIISN